MWVTEKQIKSYTQELKQMWVTENQIKSDTQEVKKCEWQKIKLNNTYKK